jgi:hypothetical protein
MVSLAIAETEAYIRPVQQRHRERATKMWIAIQTLPGQHPFVTGLARDISHDLEKGLGNGGRKDIVGITAPWNTVFPGDPAIRIPNQYFRKVPTLLSLYIYEINSPLEWD